MFDILAFPEEYKSGKEYPKDWFLKHANLTPAEKKYIMAYMQRFVVLYDIRCKDGSEAVVIYTEMTFCEGSPFFLRNYIKAIASSLPYKALIILKCRRIIKFFVYDSHANHENCGRTAVDQLYATEAFSLSALVAKRKSPLPIEIIRSAIGVAETAEELYQIWKGVVVKRYEKNAPAIAGFIDRINIQTAIAEATESVFLDEVR